MIVFYSGMMRSPLWYSVSNAAASAHRVPVVLLPGAMSTARDWPHELIDSISRDRAVYALDLRDTGRCAWTASAGYSLADMADDVAWTLESVRAKRAHVVGCSLGGAVAQHLAHTHSDRVETLTLLMSTSAGGLHDDTQAPPGARAAIAMRREWEMHGAGNSEAALVFRAHALAYPERLRPGEASQYARRAVRHGYNRLAQHGDAFARSSSRLRLLSKLHTKTLILHGEDDELFPLSHAVLMHQILDDSSLVVIPRMSHFLSRANSPRVARELTNFWDA